MPNKKDYHTESQRLAIAIDIAIDSFKKYPPENFTTENLEHFVKFYSDIKNAALNPKPQFKKLASLKYLIQDVFTFFQESSGKTVDYFWQQINETNLGYLREDKLRKILNRGKIRGRVEYDYVTDLIVAAEQEGRTTKDESIKLSQMLGQYEMSKKNKLNL